MLSTLPVSLSACASLRRATRAVCHLYDLVLAPTGLKSTQFIILQAIADAGEIAHCDLARTFAASEETFSRRLASARASGWVRMKIGERSRRMYCLTERGQMTLAAAQPYWERAEDRMKRELGESDWLDLSPFSERVTRAAIRAEHAPSRNGRPRSIA
ncbi:MAG TPA: MarR family winged helix-turn-helix transcriptional regulator [Acidobacteriaceae bacterium]|jgi:DNA-binding MarR family transcriptional regulator|nr:MarR family winged helix-turn-helix transcriptional regulator [Acidobacteriaceae bacterium]